MWLVVSLQHCKTVNHRYGSRCSLRSEVRTDPYGGPVAVTHGVTHTHAIPICSDPWLRNVQPAFCKKTYLPNMLNIHLEVKLTHQPFSTPLLTDYILQ